MQTKRSEQPTFFDLAVQQRRATNRVLDTIAREVDFSEAETRVAANCAIRLLTISQNLEFPKGIRN